MTVNKELLGNIAAVVAEDKLLPDNRLFNEKDAAPVKESKAPEAETETEPESKLEASEEESPTEGESKTPEVKAEDNSQFSDDLKQRALDIGLSEEDVKIFPSEEALDKALILIEKRGLANREKTEEALPAVAPEPKMASESIAEDDIPDLDPEIFDEKLVAVWGSLKGVNKKQAEIIEQLKNQVATFSQQFQNAHKERTLDQVEDFFGQLDKEYVPFIGKGRGSDLKPDSLEMKSRVEILEVAESIMENYARQKKTVPFKVVLQRATHAILGDKLRTLESEKIASKLEKRSNNFMPRPGGQTETTNTDGRSPEDLAAVAVKKILEKAQK